VNLSYHNIAKKESEKEESEVNDTGRNAQFVFGDFRKTYENRRID